MHHTLELILPRGQETHPMTQLSVAMLALQKDSKFFKKYQATPKVENFENLLF